MAGRAPAHTWHGHVPEGHERRPAGGGQQPGGQRRLREAAGGQVAGVQHAVLQRVPQRQVRRRRQHPPRGRGVQQAVADVQHGWSSSCKRDIEYVATPCMLADTCQLNLVFTAAEVHTQGGCMAGARKRLFQCMCLRNITHRAKWQAAHPLMQMAALRCPQQGGLQRLPGLAPRPPATACARGLLRPYPPCPAAAPMVLP